MIVRFNVNQSITTLIGNKINFDDIVDVRVAAYGGNVTGYKVGDNVVVSPLVGKTLNERFIYIPTNKREGNILRELIISLEKEDIAVLRTEFKSAIQVVAYAIINALDVEYITYS